MPLIDFHVHAFPQKLFSAIWKWFDEHAWKVKHQLAPEQVVEALEDCGATRWVLLNYAHKADMSQALNKWTHEFAGKHKQIIPFGTVHPGDSHLKTELKKCFEDYGFYGLKFHSHVTGIRADDTRMFPIYEKLIEYNRVLTLHAGTGPSLHGYSRTTTEISGIQFVRPVLKRYPELKMIIPHLGADEIGEFFELMGDHPHLYMDTAMALSGYFDLEIPWDKMEQFSDRILYGSDFPNLPYALDHELRVLENSGLSEDAKEKIRGRNASQLLGL